MFTQVAQHNLIRACSFQCEYALCTHMLAFQTTDLVFAQVGLHIPKRASANDEVCVVFTQVAQHDLSRACSFQCEYALCTLMRAFPTTNLEFARLVCTVQSKLPQMTVVCVVSKTALRKKASESRKT